MLDVVRTLSPDSGLVRRVSVVAPTDTMPLWSIGCELGDTSRDDAGYQMDLVGACGFGRAETMIRAAGEAVERGGLLPMSDDPVRFAEAPPGLPFMNGLTCEIEAPSDESSGGFYSGDSLVSGRSLVIPERLITYPWPEGGRVDDSPSGAAAGVSLEEATEAALLELVERDAVMTAWFSNESPNLVRLDDAYLGSKSRSAVDSATRSIGTGLLRIARLDSPVSGATVALATIIGQRGGRVVGAVGSKASTSIDAAFAGAIRESVQVFALMTEHASRMSPVSDPFPMTTLSRTLYWTSASAVRYMKNWVHTWGSSTPSPIDRVHSLDDLLDRFESIGLDPVRVDLTQRLPDPIRNIGWRCVKVLCPGLQRLVMDESRPGVFDPDRLPGFVWGSSTAVPHPWV